MASPPQHSPKPRVRLRSDWRNIFSLSPNLSLTLMHSVPFVLHGNVFTRTFPVLSSVRRATGAPTCLAPGIRSQMLVTEKPLTASPGTTALCQFCLARAGKSSPELFPRAKPSLSSTLRSAWFNGGGRASCNAFTSPNAHQGRRQNIVITVCCTATRRTSITTAVATMNGSMKIVAGCILARLCRSFPHLRVESTGCCGSRIR